MSIVTLADLKQAIINDLRRDDMDDVVADYIEDAIHEYQRSFFYATDLIVTVPTVAGQAFYDMPENLISINFMRLDQAGVWLDVYKREYGYILGLDRLVVPVRSIPTIWAPLDNKFRLFNVPDKIYDLELTGNGRIGIPAQDTDSNFWTLDAAPLIRFATEANIYRTRIKDDTNAQRCEINAEKYRRALMRETINKTTQRQFAAHW